MYLDKLIILILIFNRNIKLNVVIFKVVILDLLLVREFFVFVDVELGLYIKFFRVKGI